jgi:hypothetical protein
MAVVNTTTTSIASADAAGSKFARMGEPEVVFVGVAELANGDSIGSTVRLVRVPSNLRVTSVDLSSDAITTCTADVGAYEIAANGSAVVDADEFGSAVSLATAQDKTNVLNEADPTDISKAGQPLWQRLGLSADPGKAYDIALTLTAAAGSAGTVKLVVKGYTA